MRRIYQVLLACFIVPWIGISLAQQPPGKGLKKVRYSSQAEVQQLRQVGAEIIVQQPDYVIIRTDSIQGTLSVQLEAFTEAELVQRLVQISLSDSGDVQTIVDTGVDLWEVKDSTAIAQAFDIYIEKLRQSGFTVEIIAEDARNREEPK